MRIGVTGHQRRDGADWHWAIAQIRAELKMSGLPLDGYSCLAEGADQRFAEAILAVGGSLHAVIPMTGYADQFADPAARLNYHRLLQRSDSTELNSNDPPEQAFLAAGFWIVEHVDRLYAIWDEQPAAGVGGTADVVRHACEQGIEILIINPITTNLTRIPACH